jgi:hypothetical protein
VCVSVGGRRAFRGGQGREEGKGKEDGKRERESRRDLLGNNIGLLHMVSHLCWRRIEHWSDQKRR